MQKWIKVFAPATVANVGPGFDILGFAVSAPGDIVEACESRDAGVHIRDIIYARPEDQGKLSQQARQNTAGIAAINVLDILRQRGVVNEQAGVDLKLHKGMPLGSGLGSSGASAVAAAWAVNLLFGAPLNKSDPELILACVKAEAVLSGFHADNVAPSMLGGFVLIQNYHPLHLVPLDAPAKLVCVIVHPPYHLSTKIARDVLPKDVSFKETVVPQCANVAGVIAGILKQDLALLGRAIDDKIVEPARAHLIPGFADVKKSALKHGAFGCSISGAGSSVFAITDNPEQGQVVGDAMAAAFAKHGLMNSEVYVSRVNREGAIQIEGGS